jgi:hypothetical protein
MRPGPAAVRRLEPGRGGAPPTVVTPPPIGSVAVNVGAGRHAGALSSPRTNVRRRWPEPSPAMTQISRSPSRSVANAMRPSPPHAGSMSRPAEAASASWPLPSAAMRQTSTSVAGSRSEANARPAPSGAQDGSRSACWSLPPTG